MSPGAPVPAAGRAGRWRALLALLVEAGGWRAAALAAVRGGAGLLILDEPTAALDVRAETELFERFLEVTRGVTTVLVSHRLASVRHADIAIVAGFEVGKMRSIRLRPTFVTHRACTCDEVRQPMSTLKLRAETGHGSMKMLEERYFNAAGSGARARTWSTAGAIGRTPTRTGSPPGIAAWLTPTLARPLSALAERPMASKEWAVQVGMADGTFYPARVRLVQMELVVREGEGRRARRSLTEDGLATGAARGVPSQRRLAA